MIGASSVSCSPSLVLLRTYCPKCVMSGTLVDGRFSPQVYHDHVSAQTATKEALRVALLSATLANCISCVVAQ